MLSTDDVLGPGGLIARRLLQYEHREEQLEMSHAVQDAVSSRSHLAVEAGTGVGKSFAYLVPALLHACSEQAAQWSDSSGESVAKPKTPGKKFTSPDSEEVVENVEELNFLASRRSVKSEDTPIPRAVISTHTIALQEQLIEKDLPFLRSILPMEFSSVLVKGRSNYLCRRRLQGVLKKSQSLLNGFQIEDLMRIARWAESTGDGSLSDLSPRPNWEVWDDICCERGNCMGSSCAFRKTCFYAKARDRIAKAQILVVNHSLLFSDLALRISGEGKNGGGILPQYDLLVFDEAHTMEHVAAEHLGLSVSQGQVEYNLNKLHNERTEKGFLVSNQLAEPIRLVRECRYRAENFFGDLLEWIRLRPGGNGRVREPRIVKNTLSESLRNLLRVLRDCTEKMRDKDQRQELRAARNRIGELLQQIDSWLNQSLDEHVYWLESKHSRIGPKVSIHSAPIDVGPKLREFLFEKIPSVIMTSATLSTGKSTEKSTQRDKEHAFDFFKSRIGLTRVPTLQLGSPFDYERQSTLVLVQGLISPDSPEGMRERQLCETLRKYLAETDGHAFVLFTNYSQLQSVASAMSPWLSGQNMLLLNQSDGTPRKKLLEIFKNTPRSVLFGTDSFWQGVDVPGDSLQNVIIVKLPFLVPTQPLIEARLERIENAGGSSFRDYQLPSAILKFKQGFGRLIRTNTDRGIVVVLDQRIYSKSYGKQFLDALPKCTVRIDQYDPGRHR